MTEQEQAMEIAQIKAKSDENEKHNTIMDTRRDASIQQIANFLNELPEDIREQFNIDIDRLTDKEYVNDKLSIIMNSRSRVAYMYETKRDEARAILQLS